MRRSALIVLAGVCLAATLHAQPITVSNNHVIHRAAGEAQSTVVAPKTNSQCPGGRFLVTSDLLRPPTSGLVTGRNLDDPHGADIVATFDEPPGQHAPATGPVPRYEFGTNDHDLIALRNGNVLYLTGAFTRMPITTTWAADTFRGAFGPGARSNLMVWRSTDCGQSFHFIGEMDPISMEDGSCALPQFRTDSAGKKIVSKPWDMGGSDGQLVTVDPETGRLYLTFRCVGFSPKTNIAGLFELDPAAPLNKTLVAESSDEGAHWTSLGFMPGYNHWRLGAVPLDDNAVLGFGYYDGVAFGKRDPQSKKFTFDASYTKVPQGGWGWENGFPAKGGDKNPNLWSWMWAHTVVGRTPGANGYFLVFPDTAPNQGHGLRIFFYDRDANAYGTPEKLIVPMKADMKNFLFHPVVIDSGDGPPLLYWHDVNMVDNKVTIRGRFITGQGELSEDFTISKVRGLDRSFALTTQGPPGRWYGDYLTAGGGFVKAFGKITNPGPIYSYFPMWVEPDDTIRFARVDLNRQQNLIGSLKVVRISRNKFVRAGAKTPASRIRLPESYLEVVRQHQARRGMKKR